MGKTYKRTKLLTNEAFHYCPGCTHGVVHKLVGEVIEELGVQNKTIGIAPVGCAVFAYKYFDCDMQEAAHGRAPAVATGVKRVRPEAIVFTYQGDGDLASIGMAETVHAAARGENITIIFINNAIYGMTGGQMAPTTMTGQVTTTTQSGRDSVLQGNPIPVSEMLSQLNGVAYIERTSTHDIPSIIKTKNAIRKAFQNQIDKKGFSMVEVLVSCPTNWRMTPVDSLTYIKEEMTKVFPLGIFKEVK